MEKKKEIHKFLDKKQKNLKWETPELVKLVQKASGGVPVPCGQFGSQYFNFNSRH